MNNCMEERPKGKLFNLEKEKRTKNEFAISFTLHKQNACIQPKYTLK